MLKVEAVDRDKGVNDRVTYSISSENRVSCWAGLGWAREGGALSGSLETLLHLPPGQTPPGPAGSPSGRTMG